MIIILLLNLLASIAGVSGIAHFTHIGGMLFGFLVCMALLWVKLLPRDPFDFLALMQRWNRRRQYQTLVRQGYNPFGYAPRQSAPSARQEPENDLAVQRIQELRAEIHEAVAHHNLPHAALLYLELKRLDPLQVLSRQAQLDVANQLTSQQFYPQAADAYEQFLLHYPNFQQIEHVELMLGIICARYLRQYDRARVLLTKALNRLHGDSEIAMAQGELKRIGSLATPER
jgi:tetratricopeptide (TPR) repeat protein